MTTNWTEYHGTDEQIAEMFASRFIVDCQGKQHNYIFSRDDFETTDEVKEYCAEVVLQKYWIIPDDPLREMKIRHAQTGQPVWIRRYSEFYDTYEYLDTTTTPNWNIPNAEYSFTAFEDTPR